MDQMHEHESVRAAQRVIGELVTLRDQLRSTAEGFAVLDFVQGNVADELPTDTARSIVAVLRDEDPPRPALYLNDLVLFWLESYRRASSNIIMRVFDEGVDPLTA